MEIEKCEHKKIEIDINRYGNTIERTISCLNCDIQHSQEMSIEPHDSFSKQNRQQVDNNV